MIRKHNRRAAKAAFAVSLAVALVLGVLAGTARPATDAAPTIVLGSKNFPEQYILGQLYKQALEANGFKVTYKENIGSTELIHTALASGRLNVYPEYTGIILSVVHRRTKTPPSAAATYRLAKRLEARRGLTLLKPTPFSDVDVIAVTNATAKRYRLRTVADLRRVPNLKLAGFPEFEKRWFPGLRRQYGVTGIDFVPLAGISGYQALDTGAATAAAVFSTDPPLGKGSKYTVLRDPKKLFGFQHVAPIVRTSVLRAAGPKLARTLNAVSAKLTLEAMIAMNRAVVVEKQSPADVAAAFLKANKLA